MANIIALEYRGEHAVLKLTQNLTLSAIQRWEIENADYIHG
jgi:hypothetical protein